MERLVDVDSIARMLVEYLRLDLADRASFPGGQFADQTWDMLKAKMSSQPNEAKLIEAVETDPRAMHSYLVKSLELWAYQDQQTAYRLADLLDSYNQARSNITVSRGEITTEEKTINVKQTGSVDIDVTEVDPDSLLSNGY